MRKRAGVPGLRSAGVVLEPDAKSGSVSYPLIVEQILHGCGVNVVPMDEGNVMVRFPSTNGFVVSIPLSPEGADELVRQLQVARGFAEAVSGDTVSE